MFKYFSLYMKWCEHKVYDVILYDLSINAFINFKYNSSKQIHKR